MTEKKIKVTCDGTDYVDYKILVPLQGDLKIISDDNLQKLKKLNSQIRVYRTCFYLEIRQEIIHR